MAAKVQQVQNPMGRPKTRPKTHNIKIVDEAHEAARIASGYTGESLVDYVSRVVKREADKDIERLNAERVAKIKAADQSPDK